MEVGNKRVCGNMRYEYASVMRVSTSDINVMNICSSGQATLPRSLKNRNTID